MYANLMSRMTWRAGLAALVGTALALAHSAVLAQPQGVEFHVDSATQRLEMVVNTSRILRMDKEIPRVLVNNQEVLRVVPLSPTKVQVSALKPGVTQVNLWDDEGDVRTVDVVVFADARQLELVLQAEFPTAAIRVRPLQSSVVLTGYVDRPEAVSRVIRIAEDYYPKVINNISVGGVQQVSLHVKIMEVSRTKLRTLGSDWAAIFGNDFVVDSAAGIISAAASGAGGVISTGNETVQFGILDGGNQYFGFIEALRQYNFLKILAEPTLTTVTGRPASFNEGGEFPIVIPQSLGVNAVEFKQFGTRVDFVPIVLGNGNIRLEVRPEISEIDNSRSIDLNGINIPGLRTRWVDTAVELRAGQTLALAGLIQNRVESNNRGLPWLADLPWAGNLFRREADDVNEIELLVMVRPELVSALEPHQVPPLGPGEATTVPDDCDFYGRGHLEVPRCCPEPRCPGPQRSTGPYQRYNGAPQETMGDGTVIEQLPQGAMPIGDGASSNMIMEPGMTYGDGSSTRAPLPADAAASPSPQPEMFGPSGYDTLEF